MLSSIYWLKALILLKFSTTSTMASATLSASSRVLYRLKVKRTEPWALSCPPPIPRITWLVSRVRLKQADPVLTAKPLISRWRVMDSPSTSSTALTKPTAPGTFSSPPRRFDSWNPPSIHLCMFVPLRVYRPPMPLEPCMVCGEMDIRSTRTSCTSRGNLAKV